MAAEGTDVLIVGAGPTGLTLALALAQAGVDHVLVDKQAEGANTSRAAVIHARTLEVLEPFGVSAALCERGMPVHGFRVHETRRELLHFSFDGLPTAYSYLLMLPQNETEAVLLQHLQAAGGTVRRPAEFVGAQVEADGVTATIAQEGKTSQIRARYLVACDGVHSPVRQAAGLDFAGGDYAENFILADVALEGDFDRRAVQGYLSGDGLMIIAPLPGDRFRVVATVGEAPERPGLEVLQPILDARAAGGLRAGDLAWSSRFRLHHRLADAFRRGPVLLAGDAAHVHSPAGGQGMNIGIRDSAELAVALQAALSGEEGEAALDGWAERRRRIAKGVVDLTDRATRGAAARSPLVRALRDAGLMAVDHLRPVQHAVARKLMGLDERLEA
jgi:2-polyprenyl-6-methoxyphenol hydroxylase-like FAD-dependent oxidoreductase